MPHDIDHILRLLDGLPQGPDGVILPSTWTSIQRFQAVSETLLYPELQEMAQAFTDAGLDARPFWEFESDPPVVGIYFETLSLSLFFSPITAPNVLTLVQATKWAEPLGTHEISYHSLTRDKIRTLVVRALKHALSPHQPPF
jgi:hypothetical protein